MGKTREKSIINRLIYGLAVFVLIFVICLIYGIYKENNFNDYVKSEYHSGISKFKRDKEVKYSDMDTYKIINDEYNDAMFYKTIKVTPNTAYKVTCMVKTQDVVTENQNTNAGAHISISDTTEKSKSLTGTNDWTKLEFYFNSKNRETVKLGFRLGGYSDNVKGQAWFSDFTLESGIADTSNTWKFACFIIDSIDVTLKNGQKVQLSMGLEDISDMRANMQRFQTSCGRLSNYLMEVEYDIFEIKQPLTTLSYDEENQYYVGPNDVENLIKDYVDQSDYDHIFVCVRMGDILSNTEIPTHDWIGLGGMDYYGIGFSNIRLPNNSKNYIYKYDARINTFPEEVFVHEFLHSLERDCKEYGYSVPALHDNSLYGYKEQQLSGLQAWYGDYMTCNIVDKSTGRKVGIEPSIYTKKPVHKNDFEFSHKLNDFDEPQNAVDEFMSNVGRIFSGK
ncbi:MAG: hypothetical protein ACLUD1_10590 [Clostridia bacterium]|jgi:glycosyl transferase family 39